MSVNKVVLVGNLCAAATVRMAGSQSVVEFRMATEETWQDSRGNTVKHVEFHNVEVWGRARLADYMPEGRQVYVEGRLRHEQWEYEGRKCYRTKVRASDVQLLGAMPKRDIGPEIAPEPDYDDAPMPEPEPTVQPPKVASGKPAGKTYGGLATF